MSTSRKFWHDLVKNMEEEERLDVRLDRWGWALREARRDLFFVSIHGSEDEATRLGKSQARTLGIIAEIMIRQYAESQRPSTQLVTRWNKIVRWLGLS